MSSPIGFISMSAGERRAIELGRRSQATSAGFDRRGRPNWPRADEPADLPDEGQDVPALSVSPAVGSIAQLTDADAREAIEGGRGEPHFGGLDWDGHTDAREIYGAGPGFDMPDAVRNSDHCPIGERRVRDAGSPLRKISTETARLPTGSSERKGFPIATGCVDYFPDALAAVAEISRIGNDKHNPGQPLHWSRGKSNDHPDCLMRHFLERGTTDNDGTRHSAKVAWRALAILQLEIEEGRK